MNEKEDTILETAVKLANIAKGWAKQAITPRKTAAQRRWENEMRKISNLNSSAPLIERDEFDDPIPPKTSRNTIASNIKSGGNVSINGIKFNGDVVSVKCGRIVVNGIDVTNDVGDSKTITIDISGDVKMLAVDACEYVKVQGSAGKVETMSGDVTCGDVTGDVKTMSGSVTCNNIAGSVDTMSGNIRRK